MAVCVPGIVTVMLVLVIPKYREIFLDFGTALPAITIALLNLSTLLEHIGPWLILAAALLLFAWGLALLLRRLHGHQVDALAWPWDAAMWHLPIVRSAARRRALMGQLLVLHAALRAGHDLAWATRQTTTAAVNLFARRRMARWAKDLVAGADRVQSARQAGLPESFVRVLSAARNDGELAAGCEYLSDYLVRVERHWGAVVRGVLEPVAVLAWALCVAFVALALFYPMVTLIQSVAATSR
jgi:type II secretory pathway component PulF